LQKSHNNQELLSNYYLEERLPGSGSWQNPEGLEKAYEGILKLYEKGKDMLQSNQGGPDGRGRNHRNRP